jgi:hypothetical protein
MASGMRREGGLMEVHNDNDYARSPSPPTHSWPLTHSHRSQVRSCIEFSPTDIKTPVSESHVPLGGRRVSNPFLLDLALLNSRDEEEEPDQADFSNSNSNSLSLLSNDEDDDDDDDTLSSTGTLSEVFESLSRFSEVCLASVEALCSPSEPTATTPRASYPFDGGLSSGGMMPRTATSVDDIFLTLPDPSSIEAHRHCPGPSSASQHLQEGGGRLWSDFGSGGEAGGPNTPAQSSSWRSGSGSSNNPRGLAAGLGDLSYNMLDSSKPSQRGRLLPLPLSLRRTSRGQGPSGESHLGLNEEENAILSLLAQLPGPPLTCLDWQERCMELEIALQRFGKQAARVRLFLRDKVRNSSISLSFSSNSFLTLLF